MAPGDQKGRTGEMSTEQSQGMYRKIQLILHIDTLISQFQKYSNTKYLCKYVYPEDEEVQKVTEVLISSH